MSEPIRVLHVFGKLNMGGAETRVMDLYRHIDRSRVQFDFLVHHRITEEDRAVIHDDCSEELEKVRTKEDFDDEARSLGAEIYVLPRFTGTNLLEYKRACRNFFSVHHNWAVIEGHMTSMASVYLPIAKEAGIPITIAHARSAGVDSGIRGIATRLFRRSLPEKCDLMMSCSGPASVSVFGEIAAESGKILMVPNAIDVDAFRFDPSLRASMRKEFGVPDGAFVIGHVGRFDAVKNQKFLAGVGKKLAEDLDRDHEAGRIGTDSIRFFFAGKGSLKPDVRKAFEDAGLGKNVIFAGQLSREKTAAAYSAFDLFALPSLYEGLPGTVIEAQAAGLPCVIADTITDEVVLTDLVKQVSLVDAGDWAAAIEKRIQETVQAVPDQNGADREKGLVRQDELRIKRSERAREKLDAAGYNVVTEAGRLQKLYEVLAETKDPEKARVTISSF